MRTRLMQRGQIEVAATEVPLASRPAAEVPGHWLLARLGKRVLRPGGLRLTRSLLGDARIAGQHVVEFAPGMGRTATVVLDHGPIDYIGVDADPHAAELINRLVSPKGRAIAAQAAASGLPDHSADVVLAEGVLTIQSETGKQQIVDEGVRLLRPGGRYVLHELALRDDDDGADAAAIRAELAQAMHVHARPKTVAQWQSLLTDAGLRVQTVHTSPLALLEPRRVLADEGFVGALRFARNVLADKPARRRVRAMAKTLRAHKSALQAVGVVAVKAVGPPA